jgi:hypothetical protein
MLSELFEFLFEIIWSDNIQVQSDLLSNTFLHGSFLMVLLSQLLKFLFFLIVLFLPWSMMLIWSVIVTLVWILIILGIFPVVVTFAELFDFDLLMDLSANNMFVTTVRSIFWSLRNRQLFNQFKYILWNWLVSIFFEFRFDILKFFDLILCVIQLLQLFRNLINWLWLWCFHSFTRNEWSCSCSSTWLESRCRDRHL